MKETRGQMGIEEYADRIAEEMHERVEHQRRIFKQVLADGAGSPERAAYCPLVDCEKLSRVKEVLKETVDILEETRSSFKSRRLEVLRRKLIEVLAGV